MCRTERVMEQASKGWTEQGPRPSCRPPAPALENPGAEAGSSPPGVLPGTRQASRPPSPPGAPARSSPAGLHSRPLGSRPASGGGSLGGARSAPARRVASAPPSEPLLGRGAQRPARPGQVPSTHRSFPRRPRRLSVLPTPSTLGFLRGPAGRRDQARPFAATEQPDAATSGSAFGGRRVTSPRRGRPAPQIIIIIEDNGLIF